MLPKMNSERHVPALAGLALACTVLAAALMFFSGNRNDEVGQSRKLSRLVALSQKLPSQAVDAAAGKMEAFDALARSRVQYGSLLSELGEDAQSLAASNDLQRHLQTILDARDITLAVNQAAMDARALVPQLLQSAGKAVAMAGPENATALSRHLERSELTGERLRQDLHAYVLGLDDRAALLRRVPEGLQSMEQLLGGLSGGDSSMALADNVEARQHLQQTQALFTQLGDKVRVVTGTAARLNQVRAASMAIERNADQMYAAFASRLDAGQGQSLGIYARIGALVALFLACGILLALASAASASAKLRKQLAVQAGKNERNQDAILRLLDELSDLADGDLTVQATVTENITGAIADSINYAIEALRELVATINGTAVTLDSSARQTKTAVTHLARASVAQSRQVALASESVAAMAASTEEVSGNAERSSDVARHSVDVAHKGGEAVRRTIEGMNAIRETIQETSKRIKRLGESSQEIGNIVELINDIAEQTNILALNASIQASMAGEAGRGFAVVADEVQRLAERAANATKQIEVLVRTIQADTNEAVVSMERSTTDVVGGALLAENAGAALEEIEQVSNQIASLVQNISASSRQQSFAAQNIAKNMQMLREISSQTAESSAATTNSAGKLAQLSTQLRNSIAGFRLPDLGSEADVSVQDSAARAPPSAAAQAPPSTDQPVEKKVSGLSA